MARTAEEIRAEDESLKAQGVHHATKVRRTLRLELKALEAEQHAKEGVQAPGTVAEVRVDTPPAASVPEHPSVAGHFFAPFPADEMGTLGDSDPFATDEWRFLEKCAMELEIDLTRGVSTDLAKKIYNQVVAKFMAWDTLREVLVEYQDRIFKERTFPQWPELNRDPNTGRKLPPKKEEPEVVQIPDGVSEEVSRPVRAGQPSPEAVMAMMGGGPVAVSSGADPIPVSTKEALKQDMLDQLGSRPEPPRVHPGQDG